MFRVLENALVNQKIRSRHFYSHLLSRALPKVFIITPRQWEIIPLPKQHFFENILREVWYYCQYVNICCFSFTFIIFIISTFTPRRCLHISRDGRTLFWEFLELCIHFHKLRSENYFSGVSIPSPKTCFNSIY